MNYIRKHWRGELSLSVSFWINLFLLNSSFMLFDRWLTQNSIIEHPQIAGRVTIIYNIVRLGLVYPWQIVGLWRASKRHIEATGKRFWARTVQVLVVLGIFATVVNVNSSWSTYKWMYNISFKKDEFANYTLKLTKNNTIIHLQGGMGFGISEDVAELLESNPKVQGIVLDSPGGRIYEGRKLSKLIHTYGLNTYSFKGCYSICTTVFIAGKNRYLGLGANLAFHQYSTGYKNIDAIVDIKKEQETDLMLFQQQGVKKGFLDKLFNTPHDDLWYPPVEEMLHAGVIHGILNPSDISPTQYEFSSSDFDEAFINIPVFKTIKKYEPDSYQEIMAAMDSQIKKGASMIELQQIGANYIKVIAGKTMPHSSDEALIEFARVLIDHLKKLEEKDPILCMKSLYPKQYGQLEFSIYLSDEDMQPMMDVLSNIIIDAYEKHNPAVNRKAAETLMEKLVLSMGENVAYLEPRGLQNTADYKRACDAVIKLYELILTKDKKTAGNVLRYMFSQE